MKIVSIDIGTINLAVCVIDCETQEIKKWELFNISDERETPHCCVVGCTSVPKFVFRKQYYCTPHSKHIVKTPATLQTKKVKSMKVQLLRELMNGHNIVFDKTLKKKQLVTFIESFVSDHYLDKIATTSPVFNLIQTSKNIFQKFEFFFSEFKDDSMCVIIENQMGNVTSKMKTVEGMVIQYFTMSSLPIRHMECISSINKLKDYSDSKKTTKAERKKKAIQVCLEFISTIDSPNNKYIDFYRQCKKKDDLADSLLQSLWFIRHKLPNINSLI